MLSCFSMWVWKKHVSVCVWVDFEKKRKKQEQEANIVCYVWVFGNRVQMEAEGGGVWLVVVVVINRIWAFVQTSSKRTCFFMSHDVCKWVTLVVSERRTGEVWARRQSIPRVHYLRVGEDAVERAPAPAGLWEDTLTTQIQKLRARGRWDDTNQTVNSPFHWKEDRQPLILPFQTRALWSFPWEGVPHTICGCTM